MAGPRTMDLDPPKVARAPMDLVHPLASAGMLTPSSVGVKKQGKGVPIAVPTNQRRESNFSVKTANRSLMTGYRDGGSSSTRRKSSASSQGHQSPPFFPHKDDFDVVGTVPGFEKLVEAESNKLNKGKMKAVELAVSMDEEDHKEHKPAKRKKVEKDSVNDTVASKSTMTGAKGRRRSFVSLGPLSGSDSHMSHKSPSPPSSAVSATRVSPPIAGAPISRLKHITGFRNASSMGNKPSRSMPVSWPQMSLSCVRVWPKTEFTAAGMTVQFGIDRLALTIKRNTTRIPHSELKFVSYYTGSTFKIFQFATRSKLIESSILARHYDPVEASEKSPTITLFIETSSSCIASICSTLKQKGIDTNRLTSEEAEKVLATKNRRSNSRLADQSEETLFVYPFNSSVKSKSIAVRAEDVARLEDGEFLNDTLIEFGLKYAQANAEAKNAALAGQVYIFNTFFYQRLVSKPAKGLTNSYDAIKSWTSKVDLFSMKYIIVPIHENLHWYLAIITNPGLLLKKSESSSPAASSCVSEPESVTPRETVDNSDGDESKSFQAEKMAVDMEVISEPKLSHINGDEKPYILCLDSLGGSHSSVFSVLRSYLQQELLSRKGTAMNLTSKEITGKFSSKCPKQDNLWDCGVYLLHYTEIFLRSPTALLDAIVNRTDDKALWSLPDLASKRAKYKDIVIALTEQYRVYQFHRDLLDNIKGKSNGATSSAPELQDRKDAPADGNESELENGNRDVTASGSNDSGGVAETLERNREKKKVRKQQGDNKTDEMRVDSIIDVDVADDIMDLRVAEGRGTLDIKS